MDIATPMVNVEPMAPSHPACDGRDRLRRVFGQCGDALYRFILVRVNRDRDVADDLLQQTCHEAARHRRMPHDDTECEAWLHGVARNLIRRHWRRSGRRRNAVPLENADVSRQLAEDLESRPLPPDALIQDESVRQLWLAVTSLPSVDQRLVFAFYFEGRSQLDIASELRVTVKSIETRLYRVRSRLRAILRGIERM